jgi:uncharacterized protein (DUF885 family)
MNRRVVVGVAALLLGACAQSPPTPVTAPAPPPQPPTPDEQFEALGKRFLSESQEQSPISATSLGDHRFDDRLDDVSAAGWQNRLMFTEMYLAALDPIERTRLSRPNQVDALLLRHELESDRWSISTLEEWRWNPLLYTGLAGDALNQLVSRDFAPASVRMKNLGKRLDELPRFLAQVREVLQPARVPKLHAETAVRQNAGLIELLNGEVTQEIGALPAAEQESLRASVTRARSALSQHQIWLEKRLLPEAAGDFRLGEQLYDQKLSYALFSPLTRQEIRARAESEITATRAAMYSIARSVLKGRRGAPPLPENPGDAQQQTAIRAALELAYADRPARAGVLDAARAALVDATAFVREKDLVSVPDEPLEIIEMPAFKQGVALAYCEAPGPLETNQKTFYTVSPIPAAWTRAQADSFLREYNTRSIRNLTIHEAMPGHFLQLAHAHRYPSTLRALLSSGTFVEGWAVYTERLMADAGYHGDDPLMKLIQLKWYLRSVVNALLDQAVHVDGMSRATAMKLLTETAFQEEREAAGKWTRAQLTSAQLPTYFVGAQEHFALRAEAGQRAGADFSLRGYHDKLLSFGSPPVRFARELLFDLPIE